MEKIVESKLFTDEQKVSVIKAVLEKSIDVYATNTFKKSGDYYYIKNGVNGYSYVMTFNEGFQYLQLGLHSDDFFNSFEKNKMQLKNIKKYVTQYHIVLYNEETIFPYMAYDFLTLQSTYISEGKNAEFIKGIINKGSVVNLWHLIEFAAKNDINLVSHKVDDIVDISYNNKIDAYVFKYNNNTIDMCGPNIKKEIETKIEKDKFMLAIDSFADSETLKKTIFGKKIENYKQRIITYISKAIENNESSVEAYKGDLYSTPEITEFLKYICDTKKYTITTNNLSFQINFY